MAEERKEFPVKVWVDENVLAEGLEKRPELIGSIDNGTSSSRFLVFTPLGKIAASAQVSKAIEFWKFNALIRLFIRALPDLIIHAA